MAEDGGSRVEGLTSDTIAGSGGVQQVRSLHTCCHISYIPVCSSRPTNGSRYCGLPHKPGWQTASPPTRPWRTLPSRPQHHTTDTPTVIYFFLRPRCWCGKTAGNNWVRLHSTKRSLKIMLWIEKFRCQNSNLNLPTIKNGFYSFSYLKDSFHIQIWIFLYF